MKNEQVPEQFHPPTPCCGRQYPLTIPYPVCWNPFNKVVQCHSCGQLYAPKTVRVEEAALAEFRKGLEAGAKCTHS